MPAKKIVIAPEHMEVLKRAIWNTWDYIGYDVAELVGDDNEGAIEMCIDADRLTMCSHDKEMGQTAHCVLMELIHQYTYFKLLKALSKEIHLV